MSDALSEHFFFTPCLPIDDWSAQWAFLLYTLPAHWWLMRSVSISSLHPACPLMCEALSEHFAVPCFFLLPLTSAKRGCCCPLPVPQAAAPGHILQVHTYKWIDTWLFLVCLVCLVWVKRHSHWDSCTRSYPARTYGSTQAFSHPVIPCTYTRTWIDTSVFSPSHTLQVHTCTHGSTQAFSNPVIPCTYTRTWIDTWIFLVCLVCLVWITKAFRWDGCSAYENEVKPQNTNCNWNKIKGSRV